ncbi:MAG: arylsulfatase, partial [Ilumatobacter sp.]|nr:arylsulfatase [Ilumatobacter sp.]
ELDGAWWKAVARHFPGADFETEPWELFELSADPSECNDLAEAEPERLAQLIDLWWQEAETHGVLPLDERRIELFIPRLDPHSVHRPDRRYVYRPPMTQIPTRTSASLTDTKVDISARVNGAVGDEGVLIATGNENSGCSVFVQNGRLIVDYNAFGDHTIVESSIEVPAGDCTLGVHLERTGVDGFVEVLIDGQACGRETVPRYLVTFTSVGISVGEDHRSAVSTRYSAPFAYSGTLHDVTVQLPGALDPDADEVVAAEEFSRQ